MTSSREVDPVVATRSMSVDRTFFSDDDELWRRELDSVFRHSWLYVAHESEIPRPGDYVTRRLGIDDVIVARTEDGDIRVLLNACSHRGTILCKADVGNSANFRCGYHGWTFANDGTLRGVPSKRALYGDDFPVEEFGLVRARTESFLGLIFATFDDDLCDLRTFLGDMTFYLEAMLGVSPAGTDAPFGSTMFEHAGNWKLESDNVAGDGYHLRHAHRAGFEMGLMGGQAGGVEGVCVQFANGHALRAQRTAGAKPGQSFPGLPEGRWPEVRSQLSQEQANFLSDSTVVHGLIFPNLGFLRTPRAGGFDPGEIDATMFQLRVANPLSPTSTEKRLCLVTPSDYPSEWKASSFKTMQRQHGATAFFESDDMENFLRIGQSSRGREARRTLPSNFDLARHNAPFEAWFDGPGHIVGSDISEVNQRWFYENYMSMMGETNG